MRISSTTIKATGTYLNSKGKRTHHAKKSETPIEFVGVDGEGINVFVVNGSGECVKEHRYVLFGVGDDQIEDVRGLSWETVFEFLYQHYRPGTAYVGFFLGYDFTQIVKTMPENRAWMLLTKQGRAKRKHRIPGKAPHPVEHRGWQFDMLGTKRLRIRPKTCKCDVPTCKCKHLPWLYICDVGAFFQSSFLKVIDPKGWADGTAVVTDEEYALIQAGKDIRSTAILDDSMRRYNALENIVLSRVMRTLDLGFHEIGIHLPPSKWFGPGQAAQAWLKSTEAIKREDIEGKVPQWFLEASRMSYFGGWFEIMMHGKVEGEVHEYDINSAYPSIIANLPCLLHGTYESGIGIPRVTGRELCLAYARVWSPTMPDTDGSRQFIGAMLHRDSHGRILRPLATEGWYWWHELKAAEKAKLIKRLDNKGKQQVIKWVKYTPCDCPPPMRSIKDLYQKRLEVGKTSPLGKAAKLVYNSGYGKFAQSIGDPIYGNPIYASLITAGCRTMILEAIASHPKGKSDVAMVATDALFFHSPHPRLSISEKLGEWDYQSRSNLTLFKPGVYWDDKARRNIATGGSASFKARGIRASDFVSSLKRIDAEFDRWGKASPNAFRNSANIEWPKVEFPVSFSMTTALQALSQGRWERAGAVIEGKIVVQDSDPEGKRIGLERCIYNGRIVYRSRPHYGLEHVEREDAFDFEWVPSHPYEKRFGMDDPFSEESKQQLGESPDGNITDVLAWLMKGE